MSLRATGASPLIAGTAVAIAMVLAAPADALEPRRAEAEAASKTEPRAEASAAKPRAQRHHRKQVGVASVYARKFHGRKMADGTRLDLKEHVAASRTLPLGTEARVTNLETGQSTQVTIQDRGPYAKGRILDLTNHTLIE